ncbi:MAG: N-acetylglucosamine-6-phosphate deacetylase [Chitinophagaceae bacterium]|nr:N-acetylglucosamine-6-phosphate deacetylase [Chitinophagaceae bacterium]
MNAQHVKIYNGQVILPGAILEKGSVLISGEQITAVAEGDIECPDAIEINVEGNYISPGFIDIHVHGGGGYDFMDGTPEAFLKIAELHAKHGTTAMLPTTLTCEKEDLIATLKAYEQADKANNGAAFIGMHLEGPYFALNQRGAQDAKYIRDPDPEEYSEILEAYPFIRRWSAAPELKGAIDFGRYLNSKGVLAAIAHTDAIYEEVLEAFENGYTLATHFYSAMSGVTRRHAFRYAGVIESAYLLDEMDVEIIADGVHLPVPLLQLIHKIKGAGHTALITDAMRAAGMPEGESMLGNIHSGLKVIVEDGVAKLPDRTAFAGSVATADRLVRTILQAGISFGDAIQMITETPARIMKIDAMQGSIKTGKKADLVIFDREINIKMTMVDGKIVHRPEPERI